MGVNRLRRGVSPLASAIILLVILFSIGVLSSRVFTRIDLTEKQEYTLSQATKHVLDRLNDVVNVHVYFSRELPPYFATLDRQVKDLLDEYRAHSKSKVRIDYIDPAKDPALEASMQRMGIPKLQLSRLQQERAEVMNAYLGIAVQFQDKTEVIPVVENVDKLEYDLTAALVKVSTDRQTVGIVSSSQTGMPEELGDVEKLLRDQYAPQPVNIWTGPVPLGIRTLIVKDDDALTEAALYHIDQYLMSGGRILFLAPGVDVNLNSLMAQNREVKVGPQLRTYGVDVKSALVVDAQAPMVGFDVGTFFPLAVRYPWFPQVVPEGLSKKNPVTSDLQALVLPWTSPLVPVPVDTSAGAHVTTEVLARSSTRSFSAPAPYDLNPQSRVSLPPSGVESQDLVLALHGKFPSHWAGKPAPGDSLGTGKPGPAISPETQIVVVGSTHFLEGRFLQQFPSNAVFFANAVDWMTLGNDLIAIRSRGQANRPLKEIQDSRKGMLKILAVVPVPLLVVVFGLARGQLGKARRKRYAVEFGGRA
jgi:gliding motility-associatede transport system auxiliary component